MAPNRLNAPWLRLVLATAALAALAVLGGCGGGSGARNNPFKPVPPAPGPLVITPSTLTAYASIPASLTVTGGVTPYSVVSSNPSLLAVGSATSTGVVVLLPANVVVTASVLITVTDSDGVQAQATITLQPAPIFNTLTVTPASAACGANTLCSGQTATAAVTVTGPGATPIPGRQVRYDVVTGAFAIESSDPANPLVSTLTVVSDAFGKAQAILKATPGAATQPAALRATELTTGDQQTAQFTIVQTTNGSAVLSIVPTTATITGPNSATCSAGFTTDYYIYGGTPPYSVASTFPNAVTLQNVPVQKQGGFFGAITNGTCVDPLVFTITDATGLETTANLLNLIGTAAPPAPTPPSPLSLLPSNPTFTGCLAGHQFVFIISGGTPPYGMSTNFGTVAPAVVNAPGGTATVTVPGGTGIGTLIALDSGTPQLMATATFTCN